MKSAYLLLSYWDIHMTMLGAGYRMITIIFYDLNMGLRPEHDLEQVNMNSHDPICVCEY